MTRTIMWNAFGAAALAAIVLVGGAAAVRADDEADAAAIREIWTAYSTARVAGDAEAWLALWDEAGIQMPPGMPARGKDALMKGIPAVFAAGGATSMNITPEEITVADGWAYSRGVYVFEAVAQGNPVKIDGKFMTIFKRQADGSWKIYRDIFNSNTP